MEPKEIRMLRQYVLSIRDVAAAMDDELYGVKSPDEIRTFARNSALLNLAADIIEKTLPRAASHTVSVDGKP